MENISWEPLGPFPERRHMADRGVIPEDETGESSGGSGRLVVTVSRLVRMKRMETEDTTNTRIAGVNVF